jgi:death-on-curing protein
MLEQDDVHEPVWVPRAWVDAAHYSQLDEHGGSHGIRDENALESALARPRNRYAYEPEADLADFAAAYAYGIATSHPFVDGNKRTAFVVAASFLSVNGYDVERTDAEVVEAMYAVADGGMSEADLAEWFRVAMRRLPPERPVDEREAARPVS